MAMWEVTKLELNECCFSSPLVFSSLVNSSQEVRFSGKKPGFLVVHSYISRAYQGREGEGIHPFCIFERKCKGKQSASCFFNVFLLSNCFIWENGVPSICCPNKINGPLTWFEQCASLNAFKFELLFKFSVHIKTHFL